MTIEQAAKELREAMEAEFSNSSNVLELAADALRDASNIAGKAHALLDAIELGKVGECEFTDAMYNNGNQETHAVLLETRSDLEGIRGNIYFSPEEPET